MKADELAKIKERADKATVSPWYVEEDAFVATEESLDSSYYFISIHQDGNSGSNAQFIANAREDIPKLVAEVERLQAKEQFADYAIKQNKTLWEALSKACELLDVDVIDYYEEEGGV